MKQWVHQTSAIQAAYSGIRAGGQAGLRAMPPTSRQRWWLERARYWRDGMTRSKATGLIRKIKEAATA